MKPNYNIGARNGLLEQKHFDNLGNALWLYLWFLDKQPRGTDKVLGGQPVTYSMFAASYPKVPRITYVRWLDTVKRFGYVTLLRTPHGYVITINKPKKWVSDVSPKQHQPKSDVSKMDSDVSFRGQRSIKNETSNIKETKIHNKLQTNTNVLGNEKIEHKELVSKLYYQVIKAYKLPVMNHNTLRAKINAMAKEDEPDKIIKYLEFMRDQYHGLELSYKPRIAKALDIYDKRIQIREAMRDEIKDQATPRVWRAGK